MSSIELMVCGYIRENQDELNLNIPADILSVILLFYPNCIEFRENTMNLTLEEKLMITSWFIDIFDLKKNNVQLTSSLLYDYNKDGQTAKDFHTKCDNHINTFSIIETEYNGHIFGGFLSSKLQICDKRRISDDKSFLCVVRSCFKGESEESAPAIFKIKPNHAASAYYNSPLWGPAYGTHMRLNSQLKGKCGHRTIAWYDGGLYGNRLCGGNQYSKKLHSFPFKVNDMNVFRINLN